MGSGEPAEGAFMTTTKHLKTKVCLVGEKAVGKTSLIRRYVLDMFDDRYVTTIGTKVSKREMRVFLPDKDLLVHIDMTIWDIMGEKGFQELLKDAYFYGANGILAVADLTRRRSLVDLDDWIDGVEQVVGRVPVLIAINKADLPAQAEFEASTVEQIAKAFQCDYLMTSAKTGENVEEAFRRLGASVAAEQLAHG